ncbi:MAG TPA: hypothetical protein VN903_17155 [Polyangia bacterium]|nr:hypothetical protein [Polyangia bacterium]
MIRSRPLRLAPIVLAGFACVAAACGGGKGKGADGGAGGLGGDGPDGAIGELIGCLDKPGALDRPPDGRLPCDLIPPSLRL